MKKILIVVLCLLILTTIFLFFSLKEKQETDIKINIGVFCGTADENDESIKSIKNSLEILEESTNKKGGILGKKVNFIFVYGKSNMSKESKTIEKLKKKNKLVSIMAYAEEKDIENLGKEATKLKIPMLVTSQASSETISKSGEYVFKVSSDNNFYGAALGNFAFYDMKAKNSAIMYDEKNKDSKEIAECFKKYFETSGGSVSAVETIDLKEVDFKEDVDKIKASNPDLILLPDNEINVVVLARQLRAGGVNSIFLGRDVFGYSEAQKIGREAVNNSYFSDQSWSQEFETENKEFLKEYEEKYKNTPESQGILNYESARILLSSIVNSENTDGEKLKNQ